MYVSIHNDMKDFVTDRVDPDGLWDNYKSLISAVIIRAWMDAVSCNKSMEKYRARQWLKSWQYRYWMIALDMNPDDVPENIKSLFNRDTKLDLDIDKWWRK